MPPSKRSRPSHTGSSSPGRQRFKFNGTSDMQNLVRKGQIATDKNEGTWKKADKQQNNIGKNDQITKLYHSSIYKGANAAPSNTLITDATTWHHSDPKWVWRRPATMYVTKIPTKKLNGLRLCVHETGDQITDIFCYQTFVLPPFKSKITKITKITNNNKKKNNRLNNANKIFEVEWLRWLNWNAGKNITRGFPFPQNIIST